MRREDSAPNQSRREGDVENKDLQIISPQSSLPAILAAARAWAEATTHSTLERRHDLVNDKSKVVASFFALTGKNPALCYRLRRRSTTKISRPRAFISTASLSRGISAAKVYPGGWMDERAARGGEGLNCHHVASLE